jgi:hypothetical protein
MHEAHLVLEEDIHDRSGVMRSITAKGEPVDYFCSIQLI